MSGLLNMSVERLRHVHFVGICGTAMAGVAAALHERGVRVTGSDKAAYPPMSDYLAERGIEAWEGYDAAHLTPAPDLVVVGNAISRDNPEAEALLEGAAAYCSLPELIGRGFLPGNQSVVITGTHGKTTTSALAAWILRHAGLDPSWLIGGVPAGMPGGFHLSGLAGQGTGGPFVLEGDEYDTAFFDKRPKFIHYRPNVVVLNNLEYDHADIYPDMDRIREVFDHLLRIVPGSGLVIANVDEPEIRALLSLCPCPVQTYSLKSDEAHWRGYATPDRLEVRGPKGETFTLSHQLVGEHQGWNLLAAVGVATRFGVTPDQMRAAVADFRGVKRRAELIGEVGGVRVYDDFAHHPTSIGSTLAGFRARYPDRRIWALVEPRSNTMRRAVFQDELARVFSDTDRVLLREVPDVDKVAPQDRLDMEGLIGALGEQGVAARLFADAGEIIVTVRNEVKPGDVVVVLSNGGFENIHNRLIEMLNARGDAR
jgi:UDP-N-acetylmuramate: L-alanyl-gamma-D-glutamyl-meso-diaminopimelate ligase